MKQKLISLALCLLLLFPLGIAARASDPGSPWIVDNAELLTSDELAELTRQAYALRTTYDMDVVILTVDSLEGESARNYADDFYDKNGYGIGPEDSGVLLLIAMETREWYISTCGDARYAISDYDVDDLFDVMSGYLSDGEYYYAFAAYLEALPGYFEDYQYGNGADDLHEASYDVPTGSLEFGSFALSLVIGIAAGGIGLLILRGMMNSRKPQRSAADYLDQGSFNLRVRRDTFLYSRVHKTPRPQNNGSSGGRSGGSRSSGGRRHGGGGGRF